MIDISNVTMDSTLNLKVNVGPFISLLWTIKVIRLGFELASGLGINFHKSNMVEINVDLYFL